MVTASDILKARILIVDDLEANVTLLEEMLRGASYESVASTRDPHEVCALHLRNRYDLILLDLQMPGMDGLQVIDALKKIETDGYLPVLVINARPGSELSALKAGAKDFVSKPFAFGDVLMRVHNMIEVRLLHLEGKRLNSRLTAEGALQNEIISERRQIEEALLRAKANLSVQATELQGLLAERTSQLAATNKKWEASGDAATKHREACRTLFL